MKYLPIALMLFLLGCPEGNATPTKEKIVVVREGRTPKEEAAFLRAVAEEQGKYLKEQENLRIKKIVNRIMEGGPKGEALAVKIMKEAIGQSDDPGISGKRNNLAMKPFLLNAIEDLGDAAYDEKGVKTLYLYCSQNTFITLAWSQYDEQPFWKWEDMKKKHMSKTK